MAFGVMGEDSFEGELLAGREMEFAALCSKLAEYFSMQEEKFMEQLDAGLKRGAGGRMRKNLEAPKFQNDSLVTIDSFDETGFVVMVDGWKCGFNLDTISSLDPTSGKFAPTKYLRCRFRLSPQAWETKKSKWTNKK
jgi:hypothetical protein